MLPVRVAATVLCDDIRVEKNDKFFLIGVYSGSIIVPGFPTEIQVCWWIQILPLEIGRFELDLQVIKDDGSTLVRALFAFELSQKEWSAIPIPKTPLHLHGPGNLKLQMKLRADQEWTTINEFEVKQGLVPGALEQIRGVQAAT